MAQALAAAAAAAGPRGPGLPVPFAPVLTAAFGRPHAREVHDYVGRGGYTALRRAVESLAPRDVIASVTDSKLVGRGGAGFPTGLKWTMAARNPAPRYLVVNADESEPGTFGNNPYFPAATFDEHAVRDGWAFARSGDGYLALTCSQPFSLVGEGPYAERELRTRAAGRGTEHVWLVQMGRAALDGDFGTFQERVLFGPGLHLHLHRLYRSRSSGLPARTHSAGGRLRPVRHERRRALFPTVRERPLELRQGGRPAPAPVDPCDRARPGRHRQPHPRHARQPARRAPQALRDHGPPEGTERVHAAHALSGPRGAQPLRQYAGLDPPPARLRVHHRRRRAQPAHGRAHDAAGPRLTGDVPRRLIHPDPERAHRHRYAYLGHPARRPPSSEPRSFAMRREDHRRTGTRHFRRVPGVPTSASRSRSAATCR